VDKAGAKVIAIFDLPLQSKAFSALQVHFLKKENKP